MRQVVFLHRKDDSGNLKSEMQRRVEGNRIYLCEFLGHTTVVRTGRICPDLLFKHLVTVINLHESSSLNISHGLIGSILKVVV